MPVSFLKEQFLIWFDMSVNLSYNAGTDTNQDA